MAIDLNYQGKQDNGSNECGAYALTACLLALTKLPLGTRHALCYNVPGMGWSRSASVPPSTVDPLTKADPCAQAIYAVTGMCDPQTFEYSPTLKTGFNPVSALAWVAKQMGCVVDVWVDQTAFQTMVKAYPLEKCMTTAVLGAEPTINSAEPALGSNQVRLVLVSGGGHWLAQGGNGYYDPGSGVTSPSVMDDYTFSGCYITLSSAAPATSP